MPSEHLFLNKMNYLKSVSRVAPLGFVSLFIWHVEPHATLLMSLICMHSRYLFIHLCSKRICAKDKAESLKITFLPTTEFISNSSKKGINNFSSTNCLTIFGNVNKFRFLIQTRIRINLVLTTLGNELLTEDILKVNIRFYIIYLFNV